LEFDSAVQGERKMEVQIATHGHDGAPKRRMSRPAKIFVSGPLGRRLRTFLGSGQEGSALIEIALTMPMLLAVITAIFTFGVGFNNQLTLTSAVGAGAQYLQLIRTTTTDPCKDTLTALSNAAQSLKSSSISLSFNFDGVAVTGNSCAGDQVDLVQGEPVTVTATYPCVLAIYGTKFTNACQLSAKVTEYEY
jgi:Flp pilus assembly protein TadG